MTPNSGVLNVPHIVYICIYVCVCGWVCVCVLLYNHVYLYIPDRTESTQEQWTEQKEYSTKNQPYPKYNELLYWGI